MTARRPQNPAPEAEATAFLAAQPPPRDAECARLDAVFRDVTGFAPRLWGSAMIGYGSYDYIYESGRSGTCFATGFAPRARGLSVYILPGYADCGPILQRLGPHREGKACLNISSLDRIDEAALRDLIQAGLRDLRSHWRVDPT
ncbi:DUF1801 domain-containing protein [Jannaschia aquimarina]|uniref:YdhG-like domain-containing protein n=1 Tax=Jannaschia aquimarina TaxID=935700 RepID=A0A0D1ED21_9RHOB|nr:DUF1801 domain-containing protein [Jannaschia aquimarina]KIT15624.1 hypothetical protein jaqu_26050 [Jannaschia aquimarina]SNT02812.1 protein of unknown function (DU1801) [Jannaschia aquimarina]